MYWIYTNSNNNEKYNSFAQQQYLNESVYKYKYVVAVAYLLQIFWPFCMHWGPQNGI